MVTALPLQGEVTERREGTEGSGDVVTTDISEPVVKKYEVMSDNEERSEDGVFLKK